MHKTGSRKIQARPILVAGALLALIAQGLLVAPAHALGTRQGAHPITNIYIAEWSKLKHSADLGDVNSQFMLANFYYAPPADSSLPKSLSKAAKYYRMAARQNHAPSQHNLGVLLLKGQGVERNRAEAYAWFQLASQQGYRAAAEAIVTLKPHLSPEEIHEADRLVTELSKRLR